MAVCGDLREGVGDYEECHEMPNHIIMTTGIENFTNFWRKFYAIFRTLSNFYENFIQILKELHAVYKIIPLNYQEIFIQSLRKFYSILKKVSFKDNFTQFLRKLDDEQWEEQPSTAHNEV